MFNVYQKSHKYQHSSLLGLGISTCANWRALRECRPPLRPESHGGSFSQRGNIWDTVLAAAATNIDFMGHIVFHGRTYHLLVLS